MHVCALRLNVVHYRTVPSCVGTQAEREDAYGEWHGWSSNAGNNAGGVRVWRIDVHVAGVQVPTPVAGRVARA